MKELVIVGGGTAGWLAALRIKKAFNYNVTVIKSDKVGILGAGEGSTPHLISFLDDLDISVLDLIKNTNATIKNGINFVNWKGTNDSYFHGFGVHDDRLNYDDSPDLLKGVVKSGSDLDDFYLPAVITKKYKSPFIHSNEFRFIEKNANRIIKFFDNVNQPVNYSIHFDATELAAYLQNIAVERGINVIDDLVEDIILDNEGYITELQLQDSGLHACDFVFDCTGFHRLIIGKKYNSEWISLKESLPMKEAQPFFLSPDDKIHPWTEAIAQDAGWIWKIPLQHRYGCGYVYDTDYINNDQVKAKILELYPSAQIGQKTFKFDAGYHKQAAVKNCFAIGLANSFVEPLEATSIFSFILSMDEFIKLNYMNNVLHRDDSIECKSQIAALATEVNRINSEINENIGHFIQYHYIAGRNDTPFWQQFKLKNKIFDVVNSEIKNINNGHFNERLIGSLTIFGRESWNVVGVGCGHAIASNVECEEHYDIESIKSSIDNFANKFIDHMDVIDYGCNSE